MGAVRKLRVYPTPVAEGECLLSLSLDPQGSLVITDETELDDARAPVVIFVTLSIEDRDRIFPTFGAAPPPSTAPGC